LLTARISAISVALFCPEGHVIIFEEQVGAGLVQLNVAPGGVELRTIFVVSPLQIVPENGEFMTGLGAKVIARDEVGPPPGQLAFVP
jgi:hypothetical protein